MNQSDWPSADGKTGITDSHTMDDAEAAGRAIEVGSSFFLFFSSQMSSATMASHHMKAMPTEPAQASQPTVTSMSPASRARLLKWAFCNLLSR